MKSMEKQDCYRVLSEKIHEGNCIAFIGAGVSRSYSYQGREYQGIPMASELVNIWKASRNFLSETKNLEEASFLIKYYEGRQGLEKSLKKEIDKSISPLPAHNLLANIDFSCFVSMNFDTLLEKALENRNKDYLALIKDTDVSLMEKTSIPVIKPHGCISNPSSIKIAKDEVLSFNEHIPIIKNYLLSILANRTVLFIGFGLGDYDLLMLIKYLKSTLGNHMPKSFAVMRNENNYLEKFWKEYDITIINEDATLFLTELENTVKKLKFQLNEDLEPWLKNPFFMELLEIRGLPTETQVIDALLKEIKHKIEEGIDVNILRAQINDAINLVLQYRKNYHALGNLLTEINNIFERCKASNCHFWSEFSKLEKHREDITHKLNSKCLEVIGEAKNILLYSQSQRVTNLLNFLPAYKQQEIQLYIGECRPKSPASFQDAILTAKLLKNTKYKIRLVPDIAIFHYLENKSIDLILMGAHGVYKTEGNIYKYFVNTCGSSSISQIAELNNIPLKLIFEKEKEEIYLDESSLENISYDEEENIIDAAISEIAKDRDLSERTRIYNIGYDLVKWNNNIIPITNTDLCNG